MKFIEKKENVEREYDVYYDREKLKEKEIKRNKNRKGKEKK